MVDNDYTDDWGTDSGLVTDFVLRVDEAFFATDARYNGGETLLLNFKGKTDKPIGQDGENEYTVSYPCGSGWVSNDGGESAVSEKGASKFNNQSIMGKIVTSVMTPKSEGGLDIMNLLKSRGRPTQAKTWKGLTFRFETVEFNYGGEIGKKERVMPVEFIGENVDPATGVAGAAGAGAGAATATATEGTTGAGALEARLRAMAKTTDTHAAFVDKALEIPEVSADSALLERVVDENALYAEARA